MDTLKMKKLILLITLGISCLSYSQEKRNWDVTISALDSSFRAIPNVKMYFSVRGAGDWEVNTGPYGRAILSDFQPEIQLVFPCEIYCGFEPPLDSLSFWKEENSKKGMVPIEILIENQKIETEYQNSVSFEKNGNLISNTEDIMDISYHLKKNPNNYITLSYTHNLNVQKNSHDLGELRVDLIKKEIERIEAGQSDRIRVKINDSRDEFHISDEVGVEFLTKNRAAYLSSIYTIERYFQPEFKFYPNSDSLEDQAKKHLSILPEFLIMNPKLAIEVRLYTSENVSNDLARNRFRKIQRGFINEGLDHFRLVLKTISFFTESQLDSMESKNGFRNSEDEVYFYILEDDISPCSLPRQPKIHFKKFTQDLFETQCDSIEHLLKMIQSDPSQKFTLIGIAQEKSPQEIFNAKSRAELVKKKLIQKGVDGARLKIHYNVFKPQAEGKYEVWPFYPSWYEYEIGVYLEIDH
ncbi:MAG: outer membrane protein OmpA-like peptidoglycan-associated protein [Arenicella sp.]|jgi:outer membrane protein OmpA-like peptidoglycan-associated protein